MRALYGRGMDWEALSKLISRGASNRIRLSFVKICFLENTSVFCLFPTLYVSVLLSLSTFSKTDRISVQAKDETT